MGEHRGGTREREGEAIGLSRAVEEETRQKKKKNARRQISLSFSCPALSYPAPANEPLSWARALSVEDVAGAWPGRDYPGQAPALFCSH